MAPSRTEKTKSARNAKNNPTVPEITKGSSRSGPKSKRKSTPKTLAQTANKKSSKTLHAYLKEFLGEPPANKIGDSVLVWNVYHGLELEVSLQKDNVWSLFETNMRAIYVEAKDPHLTWDPTEKKKELFHKNSRYILLESEDQSELAAFCMFRFEAEENYEGDLEFLVYLYEVQVAKPFQGAGICRRVLNSLENLSAEYQAQLVMLTVFKCNTGAVGAYRHLGYRNHIDTNETAFVLFKAIE